MNFVRQDKTRLKNNESDAASLLYNTYSNTITENDVKLIFSNLKVPEINTFLVIERVVYFLLETARFSLEGKPCVTKTMQ